MVPVLFAGAQWLSLPLDRLTMEDGLPSSSVLDIMQDRTGFLWIGTLHGVARYDGLHLTVYHPAAGPQDDTPTLDLPRLYQDKAGNIWLGLTFNRSKLFRYNPSADRFEPLRFDPALPAEKQAIPHPVVSFAEDRSGRLILGTPADGLYVVDITENSANSRSVLHYRYKAGEANALASDEIGEQMAIDAHGNIWVPTGNGICRYKPEEKNFTSFPLTKDSLSDKIKCRAVVFEAPDKLWIGTESEGLLQFDIKAEKIVRHYRHDPADPYSLSDNRLNRIWLARDGRIWLGTGSGCDVLDPGSGRFQHINDRSGGEEPHTLESTTSLLGDFAGNIWMATRQSGLFQFNPDKTPFHIVRTGDYRSQGHTRHTIAGVCKDRNGILWIATKGDGLIGWNGSTGRNRHFRHLPDNPNSLGSNMLNQVVKGSDGKLWIGTEAGLDCLDPAKGTVLRYRPFPEGGASVWLDKQGNIWAANRTHGIGKLLNPANGQFRYFAVLSDGTTGPDRLSEKVLIREDEEGTLYIKINHRGLAVLDTGSGQIRTILPEYDIQDFQFDRHGQGWLATRGRGLRCWNKKENRCVGLDKSEHDKIGIASTILEDRRGCLWLKTRTGLVQFDPVTQKVLRSFSAREWLDKGETWLGNDQACLAPGGELFFGFPGGILHVHPDSLPQDTCKPRLAFTGLTLNNEPLYATLKTPISQARSIRLPYGKNNLTVRFAALDFKSPENTRYVYILENHDREWQDAGTAGTASYANLDPGRYRLQVKAIKSNGLESMPVTLHILILPPWWSSWWAYLAYTGLALLLLMTIRKFELNRKLAHAEARRLEDLNAVKNRFFTNLTHEFRTPLTIIQGLAEQPAPNTGENLQNRMSLIRQNAGRLLHLINQMLHLARTETGRTQLNFVQADIVLYLNYLLESFQSLARSKGIQLVFHSRPEQLIMDYDPEHLQTIMANLIFNAIKFTPQKGAITLAVSRVNLHDVPFLQLTLQDTGPGIPEQELPHIFDRFHQAGTDSPGFAKGTGIGLALTRELVQLMQGDITVQNAPAPDTGAIFTVRLPLTRVARKPSGPVRPAPSDLSTTYSPRELASPASLPMPGPDTVGPQPLVLLVEDNPEVQDYIRLCLQDSYRTELAGNGEEGIAKALEHVPDIIISDIMMPQRDGLDLCQILKSDHRTSHIPIILLTAKADFDSRLAGLRVGADAYLAKPFNREELLIRLANLLTLRYNLQTHYRDLVQSGTAGKETPESPVERQFLQNLRTHLESDLSRQWTVPDLALEMHISPSQLYRKLEALTGMHTTEFIRSVRLEKAKQLLQVRRKDKVAAIAFDVGFPNAQEFSRRFRERFGMTPSQWQRHQP